MDAYSVIHRPDLARFVIELSFVANHLTLVTTLLSALKTSPA